MKKSEKEIERADIIADLQTAINLLTFIKSIFDYDSGISSSSSSGSGGGDNEPSKQEKTTRGEQG